MTARLPRNQRSDARDNRERIVGAAGAAFVSCGPDVPIREIARRAGLGPATVYRHFPTRTMLFTQAFTERMLAWRSAMAEGLLDPDPWRGFRITVEKLCVLQAHDLDFTTAFKQTFPRAVNFAAMRASSLTSAAELLRRVKDAGHLRPGIDMADLSLMMMAGSGIRASTPTARVAASRRFAGLMLQSFRRRT